MMKGIEVYGENSQLTLSIQIHLQLLQICVELTEFYLQIVLLEIVYENIIKIQNKTILIQILQKIRPEIGQATYLVTLGRVFENLYLVVIDTSTSLVRRYLLKLGNKSIIEIIDPVVNNKLKDFYYILVLDKGEKIKVQYCYKSIY